jgi:anthranilate/para-aminobenzoate synthase component I
MARDWQATGGIPTLLLRSDQDGTRLWNLSNDTLVRSWADPFAALHWVATESFSSSGRWVGFLGYDLAYHLESIGAHAADDVRLPLFAFAFFPNNSSAARVQDESIVAVSPASISSTFSRPQYESAVARAKEFIAAGDIFQVNLSQRFTIPTALSATQIYRRLLRDSPAAYSAMLDFGDFALISNSPELFISVDTHRRIITRPIKGTRPRQPGMEGELRHSVKDQAELNMIIDLERNDLGRICEIGSVRVCQPRTIEAHPTIYHGVATIEGVLCPQINFLDVIRAMFPGGSVTGAPKIRAMQIIDELEPVRRGPYCGTIGYLDSDGSMQFNLAIRTIVLKEGRAHVSVGGGIVADSVPGDEYDETLVKARAMFSALGVCDMTKFE